MAVALVALFGLFGAYRALLPVASDLQTVCGNPELDQEIFGSGGPADRRDRGCIPPTRARHSGPLPSPGIQGSRQESASRRMHPVSERFAHPDEC